MSKVKMFQLLVFLMVIIAIAYNIGLAQATKDYTESLDYLYEHYFYALSEKCN